MVKCAVGGVGPRGTSARRGRFAFGERPDRRDLHSFPTRRSSDLPAVARGEEPAALLVHDQAGWECVEDRKSTRLNSSHRCTSYAVFCLKKKSYSPHPRRWCAASACCWSSASTSPSRTRCPGGSPR